MPGIKNVASYCIRPIDEIEAVLDHFWELLQKLPDHKQTRLIRHNGSVALRHGELEFLVITHVDGVLQVSFPQVWAATIPLSRPDSIDIVSRIIEIDPRKYLKVEKFLHEQGVDDHVRVLNVDRVPHLSGLTESDIAVTLH